MIRNVAVEDISDGRKYRSDDLVKIGTNGCQGCCDCCRMDPVIVLDPWDVYMLQKGTGLGLEKLLGSTVKLEVIDGLIQPVLQMAGGACPYLGADGRCQIHDFRPGICRLYPLGRSWEPAAENKGREAAAKPAAENNGQGPAAKPTPESEGRESAATHDCEDFSYILQVNECTHCTGSKVKVKKWLGIPDLIRYEDFCREWHAFLKAARNLCGAGNGGSINSNMRKIVCMQILEKCYMTGFDTASDFYPQFEDQLKAASASLGLGHS